MQSPPPSTSSDEKRSPRRTPEEKRKSPRLEARTKAAKIAARSIATAVRERVWAEARTEDGKTYYYHLDRGITAWVLPQGSILRAAGRNSLAPIASNRDTAITSPRTGACQPCTNPDQTKTTNLHASHARPHRPHHFMSHKDRTHATPHQYHTSSNPHRSTLGGGKALELSSLLTVVVDWLDDTKALYQEARSEIYKLRIDQQVTASRIPSNPIQPDLCQPHPPIPSTHPIHPFHSPVPSTHHIHRFHSVPPHHTTPHHITSHHTTPHYSANAHTTTQRLPDSRERSHRRRKLARCCRSGPTLRR